MPRCNVCSNSFEGTDCPTCQTVTGLDLSVFTEGQAIYVRTSGVPGKDSPASLEEASTRRKFALAFPVCRLGRDPVNDVVVNGDDSVSRFHAEITFEDNAFYVNDKGSTNGTFLNGKPVIRRTALTDGDRVRVGRLRFKFLLEVPVSEDAYRPFFRDAEEAPAPALEGSSKLNMTLDMAMPDDLRSKLEDKIVAFDAPDNRTVAIPKKIANLITELEDLSPFPGSIQSKAQASSTRGMDAPLVTSGEVIPLSPPSAEPDSTIAFDPAPSPEPDEAIPLSQPEPSASQEPSLSEPAEDEGDEAIALSPPADLDAPEAIPLGGPREEDSPEDIPLAGGGPREEDSSEVIARAAANVNGSDDAIALGEPSNIDPIAVIARAAAAANGPDDVASAEEGLLEDPAEIIARAARAANGSEESPETIGASEDRKPEPAEMETPQPPESEYLTESTTMQPDFPRADEQVQLPEPAWCDLYLPDELGRLQTELAELNEVVISAQQKIREVETRIALTRGLRTSLLAGRNEELHKACGKVLELLGWGVKANEADPEEIVLTDSDNTVAIGRIVWTKPDALYQHLGKLAMAQVAHWCQHRTEPAGLLIVNTFGHDEMPEGKEVEFSEELEEFARRKNVCVMTTLQLLCIYKELELGNNSADSLRQSIVVTTGRLPGYKLEPTGALVTV